MVFRNSPEKQMHRPRTSPLKKIRMIAGGGKNLKTTINNLAS